VIQPPTTEKELKEVESLEIDRGRRGQRLIADPLLVEAVETLRERWEEEIYRCLAALDEVWLQLQSVITSGKMAETAQSQRQGEAKGNGRTGRDAA
jgi:hypothetical protein